MDRLPHLLDLSDDPALFQGERDLFRQVFAQRLRSYHIELPAFGIYDKESCRIGFQDVAEKAHKRLVRVGIHRPTCPF